MNSPYKYHLDGREKQEIVIHRANASDLKGELVQVNESGCVIHQPASPGMILSVFVAFEDIRGVGHEDHDYDNL